MFHVLFVTKRPKDVPRLRCKVTVTTPHRLTVVPKDVDVVAVHRTVGHMPVAKVRRLSEKAKRPWCVVSTGSSKAIEEIRNATTYDLSVWRVRGFWAGPIGSNFLRTAAEQHPTDYDERARWLSVKLSQAEGSRVTLNRSAMYAAYKRDAPELLAAPLEPSNGAEAPLLLVPDEERSSQEPPPEAPSPKVVEGSPCPADLAAFEGLLRAMVDAMTPALVAEVTAMAGPEGTVAWNYKHKVVRLIDVTVEGP